MLVSSTDLIKLVSFLRQKRIVYTVLIDDMEKAVDDENLRHAGTVFSAYSGYDYGRYHNLHEVWPVVSRMLIFFSKAAKFFFLIL